MVVLGGGQLLMSEVPLYRRVLKFVRGMCTSRFDYAQLLNSQNPVLTFLIMQHLTASIMP